MADEDTETGMLTLFAPALVAMPAWSKEIAKETTMTTKEIIVDDAKGIKLYGQIFCGQYKKETYIPS